MKYFVIRELLEEEYQDLSGGLPPEWTPVGAEPYVVIVSKEEWSRCREKFDMGIELEPVTDTHMTKAEVNYDSLTGTFSIPDRKDPSVQGETFAFALDEKGVVFIDDTGTSERIIRNVQKSKRWRSPSLGRFLYDFLDDIVKGDLRLLEKYEQELEEMEAGIEGDRDDSSTSRSNAIRSDIRRLLIHYDQLIDLAQELEENENGFFDQDVLRYFRLFLSRIDRLYNTAASIRDYTMQIATCRSWKRNGDIRWCSEPASRSSQAASSSSKRRSGCEAMLPQIMKYLRENSTARTYMMGLIFLRFAPPVRRFSAT